MTLAKIAKGVLTAGLNFIVVGLAIPYLIEHFSPQIATYITLPAPSAIWTAFLLIGAGFAVTGFLQSAYSKGHYPWLAGKLGSAVPSIALFTYLYSLIPGGAGSELGGTVQTSQLLYLIYLALALSYLYLVLDFYDARRTNAGPPTIPLK